MWDLVFLQFRNDEIDLTFQEIPVGAHDVCRRIALPDLAGAVEHVQVLFGPALRQQIVQQSGGGSFSGVFLMIKAAVQCDGIEPEAFRRIDAIVFRIRFVVQHRRIDGKQMSSRRVAYGENVVRIETVGISIINDPFDDGIGVFDLGGILVFRCQPVGVVD